MARVVLASALARWLPEPGNGAVTLDIAGDTLIATLDNLFALHPRLRGYVLDERGALRRHVALFVDGDAVHHGSNLQQALGANAEIYVMQALSGG